MKPMTQGITCQVCGKQRDPGTIHPRQSKLIKTVKNMLICNKCDAEKKEPRSFIIIVARAKGIEAVADYIENKRYEGPPLLAEEIYRRS